MGTMYSSLLRLRASRSLVSGFNVAHRKSQLLTHSAKRWAGYGHLPPPELPLIIAIVVPSEIQEINNP